MVSPICGRFFPFWWIENRQYQWLQQVINPMISCLCLIITMDPSRLVFKIFAIKFIKFVGLEDLSHLAVVCCNYSFEMHHIWARQSGQMGRQQFSLMPPPLWWWYIIVIIIVVCSGYFPVKIHLKWANKWLVYTRKETSRALTSDECAFSITMAFFINNASHQLLFGTVSHIGNHFPGICACIVASVGISWCSWRSK